MFSFHLNINNGINGNARVRARLLCKHFDLQLRHIADSTRIRTFFIIDDDSKKLMKLTFDFYILFFSRNVVQFPVCRDHNDRNIS